MIPLHGPEDEVRDCGDWEQNGHAKTVHHGDEGDVKNLRVLEVDDVVGADVQVDIAVDLRLFRAVNTVTTRAETTVNTSLEARNYDWNRLGDQWHERVDEHGLYDVVADKGVPARRVVSELTVEEPASIWVDLFEVGVDEQD